MEKTRVVLFTTNNISGNMVCSFLHANYNLQSVVLDSALPGARKRMIKRRIKKLGFFNVLQQAIFQKGLVPFLKIESKSRQNELTSDINQNAINTFKNCFRPSSINDDAVIKHTNDLNPDVIMVCGTGIIKKRILKGLNAPLINIHVGITPKYRGVHGGYWALANNDLENCGVTVHLVDPGIDTGGILSQRRIKPLKADNYCTYPLLQMKEGLNCIKEAITQIETDSVEIPTNTLESKLYYHPTITKYLYRRLNNGVK